MSVATHAPDTKEAAVALRKRNSGTPQPDAAGGRSLVRCNGDPEVNDESRRVPVFHLSEKLGSRRPNEQENAMTIVDKTVLVAGASRR
jgi:hypothetical protein